MSYHQTRDDEYKFGRCASEGCTAKYDNHHWGTKRAQREGWFFQKDGARWCPDHTPTWVATWRARKARA